MALHPNEINNRFKRHRPVGGDGAAQSDQMEKLHVLFGDLARQLNDLLRDGREKSTVLTKLEEGLMWSIKATITPPTDAEGNVSIR